MGTCGRGGLGINHEHAFTLEVSSGTHSHARAHTHTPVHRRPDKRHANSLITHTVLVALEYAKLYHSLLSRWRTWPVRRPW